MISTSTSFRERQGPSRWSKNAIHAASPLPARRTLPAGAALLVTRGRRLAPGLEACRTTEVVKIIGALEAKRHRRGNLGVTVHALDRHLRRLRRGIIAVAKVGIGSHARFLPDV